MTWSLCLYFLVGKERWNTFWSSIFSLPIPLDVKTCWGILSSHEKMFAVAYTKFLWNANVINCTIESDFLCRIHVWCARCWKGTHVKLCASIILLFVHKNSPAYDAWYLWIWTGLGFMAEALPLGILQLGWWKISLSCTLVEHVHLCHENRINRSMIREFWLSSAIRKLS